MPKTRRFVLTLKDARPPGPSDVAQVEKVSGKILDRAGRTLKVEAPDQKPEHLASQMPNWHVQPEVEYKVPDTRRHIEHPPEPPKGKKQNRQ